MRGNPQTGVDGGSVARSIPACAGEPPHHAPGAPQTRVYPRVCGGTTLRYAASAGFQGLSPRVRGNRPAGDGDDGGGGSIPACAGEPPWHALQRAIDGVYPRVCGGTLSGSTGDDANRGLSPRVRGNRRGVMMSSAPAGSIPACAGEPLALPGRNGFRTVYPRVCGGTCRPSGPAPGRRGLSPRVRGNPGRLQFSGSQFRSIPACAGEPPSTDPAGYAPTVYPRVCGGTRKCGKETRPASGLSPRVRGNPHFLAPFRVYVRSIPACAGEPKSRTSSHALA